MTEPWQLNASEMVEKIKAGDISATEITRSSLQRLDDVNPRINAVVQEMPEEALAAASDVDKAIREGRDPGILAGVPVTIKVNIDQAGHANTNGLRLQQGHVADQDHPVVANLRRAGAIIIGRTNTPAFSMRWFTRNSLHGHTLNPRNQKLTPGGSSGGAAAAVAAGIGAIGHGTDIAGSIRYPAYACGLHGIRPTLGRVPAVNLSLPDRHIGAQMTAVSGPMTRSISDLEMGLEAMAVGSALDPWWTPVSQTLPEINKKVALCINPDGLEVSSEIEGELRKAAQQLAEDGWQISETDIPPMREAMHLQLLLWMSEYHYNNAEALERENDPDANFVYAQLREFCPDVTLHNFMEAFQRRIALSREWEIFLSEYPILLCPVSGEPPFPDLLDVESPEAFKRVAQAQMPQIGIPFMGMPAMTVTTDNSGNTPMGVQLVAGRFREDVLFDAARAIESRNPALKTSDPV
ncbi:MAG: amidase family protein [Pseudomonadota bacterium]